MTQACDSMETTVLPPSFDSDNPPDFSIRPKPGGGANTVPPPDTTGSDWIASPCNPKARYRITDDGYIEVEGLGIPVAEWPTEVDKWKPLIEQAADANGISRALLAGLVATESGGKANLTSTDGRLGLTQIPRKLARQVANMDYPKSTTEVDVPDEMILNPAWNLIHGSKALSILFKKNDMNLIGAIAEYDHSSAQCGVNPECGEDKWGMWTDCNYVDQVIEFTNAAVNAEYTGSKIVDLGPPTDTDEDEESSILPYLLWGAVGIGAAVAIGKIVKDKKSSR